MLYKYIRFYVFMGYGIGYVEILKKAKELGDFLFVGLHNDATVKKYRGNSFPILNLQERTFNLLA